MYAVSAAFCATILSSTPVMRPLCLLSALALSGCFGSNAELLEHPSFGRAVGLSYKDQASFQRSLTPEDQITFFMYMNHTLRPPNLALRDELGHGGVAVFDGVVLRLRATSDEFDMASLSAALKAAVENGVSLDRARAALGEVKAAASRATNPYYKAEITQYASNIERAIERLEG